MRLRAVMQGALFAAACIAYAAASYVATRSLHPTLLGAGFAYVPLLLVGAWMAWKSPRRVLTLPLVLLMALVLWLDREALLRHYRWGYLVQSAGPMVMLALFFGASLRHGQVALITRLALLVHEGHVTPRTARYTRGITWAWTLFFALMALVSIALFLAAPPAVWALFANVLSGPLVLAMFIGEYAVRVLVLPAQERTGPVQAVTAFMRYRAQTTEHAMHDGEVPDSCTTGHRPESALTSGSVSAH